MIGDRKSRVDVSFYVDLLENVLRDSYACYPEIPQREFERDMMSIRSRVRNEGIKFLTVQLPTLRKAIDRSLETGELVVPEGFGRKAKAGTRQNIPKLFSALFLTTYTPQGALRHEKSNAVPFLRRICDLCYKVKLPFSSEAMELASRKFKEVDSSLIPLSKELKEREAFRYARLLLQKLLRGFDPRLIMPRHGPGAVAEKLHGRSKYNFDVYDREIDQLYPYVNLMTFGVLAQSQESLTHHLTWAGEFPPSRVCLVPKDSRGPRVIAAEPALLQYLQQGLGRALVDHVEQHPLTRGHVLFTDQTRHRGLALRSSKDRRFATLDLKDASDRVSLDLVQSLFPESIVPYLTALRSKRAILPNKEIVSMKKFASMGSALCFPIEALTFFALASGALWSISRRRVSKPQPVFVYGDDIIAPTEHAEAIISELELYGVRFNRDKCCIQGFFRESCGQDAFLGEDVTPVRVRALVHVDPRSRRADLVALNENANAFFDRGYWRTAKFLDDYVERWWGEIPTTSTRFAGLSRRSSVLPMRMHIPSGVRRRWNRNLQRVEICTIREKSRKTTSPFPSSVCRLGHNLVQGVSRPYEDEVAVAHSALPKVVWEELV